METGKVKVRKEAHAQARAAMDEERRVQRNRRRPTSRGPPSSSATTSAIPSFSLPPSAQSGATQAGPSRDQKPKRRTSSLSSNDSANDAPKRDRNRRQSVAGPSEPRSMSPEMLREIEKIYQGLIDRLEDRKSAGESERSSHRTGNITQGALLIVISRLTELMLEHRVRMTIMEQKA